MNDRVSELLIEWEEHYRQGIDISISELCKSDSSLKDELQAKINALKNMSWMDDAICEEEGSHTTIHEDHFVGTTIANRYRVEGLVGEGGFGKVYEGLDLQLSRTIAIKISRKITDPQSKVDRLLHEARLSAQLVHPNIVRVYDVGVFDGRYFTVSEFVDGQSLETQIGDYNSQEAAALISKIAGALAVAHKLGIVHLDVKPANILIDQDGEPRLTDFGISRSGNGDHDKGQEAFGTVAYMSPEQLQGKPINHQSDLYSLGVVFYRLLTEEFPYKATTPARLMSAMEKGSIPLPSTIRKGIPKQIELACVKCLSQDPSQRFENADQLVVYLEAHPPNRRFILVALIIGLATIAGLTFVPRLFTPSPFVQVSSRFSIQTPGHVTELAMSPDGKRVYGANMSTDVQSWDVISKDETTTFEGHQEWGRSVTCSPGNNFILSGEGGIGKDGKTYIGSNHSVRMWSMDGRLLKTFSGHIQPVLAVAIREDATEFASADGTGSIRVWDIETGEQKDELLGHFRYVLDIEYYKFGLLSVGHDGTLRSWHMEKAKERRKLQIHVGRIWSVDVSSDNNFIATGGDDRTAQIRTSKKFKLIANFVHPAGIRSVAFSPDAELLVTGCIDGKVRLWNCKDRKLLGIVAEHEGKVLSVVFSSDGKTIISSANDGSLEFRELSLPQ